MLQSAKLTHVRELCERADVNRSTFYFRYADIYELLSGLEEEFLAHVPYTLFTGGPDQSRPTIGKFVAYICDNRDLYCVLYQQHRIKGRVSEEAARRRAKKRWMGSDSLACGRQRLLTAYSCTGDFHLIYDWLADGGGLDAREVTDLILSLLYYTDQARRAAAGETQ